MREVIERLTCNIGGESVLSDEDNLLSISEETFVWGEVTYAFDVCGKCRSKMMRMSITDLIAKSVRVTPVPKKKKAAPKKRPGKEPSSVEKWADYKQGDSYLCPDPTCDFSTGTARSLGAHVGQQHKSLRVAS